MEKVSIVLFGTGGGALKFVQDNWNKESYEIVALSDNDLSKVGKTMWGHPIIHPSEIMNSGVEKVVIASSYYNDIKKGLQEEYGIPDDMIADEAYVRKRFIGARYEGYYKKHKSHLLRKPSSVIGKKEKLVIYTAIFGGRDNKLLEPKFVDPNTKYICFTDAEDLESDVWEVRHVKYDGDDPMRFAKTFKMLPHKYFGDYCEWSIWVDGNIEILGDMRDDINKYITDGNMLCNLHRERTGIYEESELCIRFRFDYIDVIEKQMEMIRAEGFPDDNELIEGAVLIRKHNCEDVKQVMEAWLDVVEHGSRRDQLSFNYVAWKYNFFFDITDLYSLDNPYYYHHYHMIHKPYER